MGVAVKFLSLLICLCLLAPGAYADPVETNRADVIRLLQKIVAETPVRAELEALGFRGENLELAIRQSQVFVQDPGIAGYMADLLIAANAGQVPQDTRSGGMVQVLFDRGISHLTLREMRHFYLVEQSVINAFPVRDCGRTVKGRPQTRRQQDMVWRVEAQMNTVALKEYYRIQLKAARLGLRHRAKTLSPDRQAKIVEKIYTNLALRVADTNDARGLIAAYQNVNRVSNRRACTAGRLFMETVLNLQGNDLRDALILLSVP
jgi:hypothetical protein